MTISEMILLTMRILMIIIMGIVIINYIHDDHDVNADDPGDDHADDPGDDHDFNENDSGAVSWKTRVVAQTHLPPYK